MYKIGMVTMGDIAAAEGRMRNMMMMENNTIKQKEKKRENGETYVEILVDSLCNSLLLELMKYYGEVDGKKIYVYAFHRLLSRNNDYDSSYISEVYKEVDVSKDSIDSFIRILGKNTYVNKEFLASRYTDYRVLIFDRTAINDKESNSLNVLKRDSKEGNEKPSIEVEIYDTISKEPIYYVVRPGNVVDKTSFIGILDIFDTKKSIIIVDKGFNTLENIEYLNEHKLNYIMPFNDNAKVIRDILSSSNYEKAFSFNGHNIIGLKRKIDDKIYYLFKNSSIASAEENSYIKNIISSKKGYTIDELNIKSDLFGVICFTSSMDLDDISQIYIDYFERWEIEANTTLSEFDSDHFVIDSVGTIAVPGIRFLNQIEKIMISRIYQKLKVLDDLKELEIRQNLSEFSVLLKKHKWVRSIINKNILHKSQN